MHAEAFPEPFGLIDATASPGLFIDFLQGHDVRIEGFDHGCGSIEVQSSVHAQTVLDVPGRDPE